MKSDCKMCGLILNSGDQYCRNCGFRVPQEETHVPNNTSDKISITNYPVPIFKKESNISVGLVIAGILFLGIFLTTVSFLIIKATMRPQNATVLRPDSSVISSQEIGTKSIRNHRDPLDQFIDQSIAKKLGGTPPLYGGAQSTEPQVRQASEQELREANAAIQNGQQLANQGRWSEAAQQFYFAKERAVGTDIGMQAEKLYKDASSHTDLFGGAIRRGN
jgi:hypothetical protein